MTKEHRFVRQPGPGDFRGEGTWVPFVGDDDEWNRLRATGLLPVGCSSQKRDGWVTFGKWAVPIPTGSRGHEWAAMQAKSLAEQMGGSTDG